MGVLCNMKLKFNKKILLKYTYSDKILELYIGYPPVDECPLYIKTDQYIGRFLNDIHMYFISKSCIGGYYDLKIQ